MNVKYAAGTLIAVAIIVVALSYIFLILPSKYTLYENKIYGFSLQVDKNWTIKENYTKGNLTYVVSFILPSSSSIDIRFQNFQNIVNNTFHLEDFKQFKNIVLNNTGFQLRNESIFTMNSISVYKLDVSRNDTNQTLWISYNILIKNDKMFFVNYKSPSEFYSKYLIDFEKSLSTFKIS